MRVIKVIEIKELNNFVIVIIIFIEGYINLFKNKLIVGIR